MTNRAEKLSPASEAAEAVKAYLRMHRAQILEDAEFLRALLPDRFAGEAKIDDFQRHVIEKLQAENAILKVERDGLRHASDRAALTREGVRKLVLELIEARSFEKTIAVATDSAAALDVDRVALGVESAATTHIDLPGMCLLPPGLTDQLIESDATGALIKGRVHPALFWPEDDGMESVALFRLDIGSAAPAALFAVGSRDAARFDDESETREIAYFVRALERTIGAWLDLPTS
jgi:hypothetical protein